MNLPLLYWASEQTNDPRFAQIARLHADTTQKYFVRKNGSVIHIGEFDPQSGEFLQSIGGQGYGRGCSWTRGQAWAVYGFTLSYLHTKKKSYLVTAERVADAKKQEVYRAASGNGFVLRESRENFLYKTWKNCPKQQLTRQCGNAIMTTIYKTFEKRGGIVK